MTVHELEVTVRDHDGVAVIDLAGDVNSAAENALDAGYEEAAAVGGDVALNFTDVDYINSTGIALIVGLLAQARANAVHVSACGLSEHYREIFEITRLSDFMTIADDEDRAVNSTDGSKDD